MLIKRPLWGVCRHIGTQSLYERVNGFQPVTDFSTGLRRARCWSSEISLLPVSSIQFFFSGMGARSSSSLERNSSRIGEVFALL